MNEEVISLLKQILEEQRKLNSHLLDIKKHVWVEEIEKKVVWETVITRAPNNVIAAIARDLTPEAIPDLVLDN